MKTIQNIRRTIATLLAWACVVGVLFLGATNAHAQGFPVKPRFQDVRIGFTTFAECEAYFGAGACDLTAEGGVFSQGGFATPNNVSAFDVTAEGTVSGANGSFVNGQFTVDALANVNITTEGSMTLDTDTNASPLNINTSGGGDIVMRPGDDFDLQAAGDAAEIGVSGGAYELRLVFGDVIVNAADDVTLQPVDTLELIGDDINAHPTSSMLINTPAFTVTSAAISAATGVGGGDIVLDANDGTSLISAAGDGAVQIVGGDTVLVSAANALALEGSSVTVNGTDICLANGTNCPSASIRTFGRFSNGGTCTVDLGSNIDSCSRGSQGVLTITFTTSFAQAPACTASPSANDQIWVRVTASAGGVVLRTYQDGAGLEDEDVTLICEGNFPI